MIKKFSELSEEKKKHSTSSKSSENEEILYELQTKLPNRSGVNFKIKVSNKKEVRTI
jgi:hypothetical protein